MMNLLNRNLLQKKQKYASRAVFDNRYYKYYMILITIKNVNDLFVTTCITLRIFVLLRLFYEKSTNSNRHFI